MFRTTDLRRIEQQNKSQRGIKKPYARPQLVKHGNVETLTQGRHSYPSGPIQWPNP